ncbi:MAG: hypothetical protein ABL958_05055 [Bdellovibrionia bacterium]
MKIRVLAAFALIICMTNFAHARTVFKQVKPARLVAQEQSVARFRPHVEPLKENNIKLFPLKAIGGSIHLGYDRALSQNWVIGAEFSFMTKAKTPGDIPMGDRFEKDEYQEHFGGLLAQYFFTKAFKGLYVEGGANYVYVKGYYIPRNRYTYQEFPEMQAESDFFYPHLGAGYRLQTSSGLNFGLGLGGGMYIGETLTFRQQNNPYQYQFNYPVEPFDSPYYSGKLEARARIDVSFAF